MRILVTWGTKRGGTEGIAQVIAAQLRERGHDVTELAANVASPDGFDAVIVGGALYANRWHRHARRFVARHAHALRRVPTWLFSSGPLDDSADQRELHPPHQVSALMRRVGALGHATFGGRLAADAKGFAAQTLAKQHAGDWRNPTRIRAWADQLADELPAARPGVAVDPPARGLARWLGYALIGWSIAAAVLLTSSTLLHVLVAPVVFLAISWRYFAYGARDPLPTALLFGGVFAVLELAVIAPRPALIALTATLVLLVTWAIGLVRSTMPWPRPERRPS